MINNFVISDVMEFARIESFAIIRKRQSGMINNFVISDVMEFARIESFAIIRKRQSGVINRIKSFYNNSKKKWCDYLYVTYY